MISPWAKSNYVDNTLIDQSSVVKFIEQNWSLPALGNGAADTTAGSLLSMFDFSSQRGPRNDATIPRPEHRRAHQLRLLGKPLQGKPSQPSGKLRAGAECAPARCHDSAARIASAAARSAGYGLVNSTCRAVGGVREPEPDRVQPLPVQARAAGRQHRIGSVEPVAHARMPDRRHVHPDLVGPAGLQVHLKQGGRPEGLQGVVMRHRRPPVGDHREPPVAGRMPGNRRVDRPAERIRVALDQRVVDLVRPCGP